MIHLPRLDWEIRDGRLWVPRWQKWVAFALCGLAGLAVGALAWALVVLFR